MFPIWCLSKGLEHAVVGTALHVIRSDEGEEEAKKIAMKDMGKCEEKISHIFFCLKAGRDEGSSNANWEEMFS
ncbi:unnamed protein product [Arabis nemorensis]|uniref:Uncharacterized protein n=1 Tax=Arabis nemorensis TaxID=586526 RepID=A0A565CP99_9BRAS|nr:unnamed protein product [Arabis nemorensis]